MSGHTHTLWLESPELFGKHSVTSFQHLLVPTLLSKKTILSKPQSTANLELNVLNQDTKTAKEVYRRKYIISAHAELQRAHTDASSPKASENSLSGL